MLISLDSLVKKYSINSNGVIHVGAHYGEEVSDYIKNGISNIVLFEPLKDNYDILLKTIGKLQANIQVYKVALGSKIEKVTMYVSDNEKQSSSILKPKIHLSHHPNVYFPDIEEVELNILDSYNFTEYDFICMDVQGYELEVLKGAKNTLKHVNYVYCEVNRDEVYEGNAYIEEIDDYLNQYNLKRVETDWSGGIWGDAFYIKSN